MLFGAVLVLSIVAAGSPAAGQPAIVCEEVLLQMDDSVRLHGWISHREGDVPLPVSWTMTPYANLSCTDPPTGFVRAVVSMRGTGASEGTLDGYAARDQADWLRVADDLAAHPWSDGSILATGASATAAWISEVMHHPAVEAAVPHTTCHDGYRGCLRPGGGLADGVLALDALILQGYIDSLQTRLRLGTADNPPPAEQLAAMLQSAADQFVHDRNDAFWQSRLGLWKLRDVRIPVFYTTDLYDIVPSSMYLAYERTPDARLSMGDGHNSGPAFLRGRLARLIHTPLGRFTNHYMLGQDNGAENDPRVTTVINLGSPVGYKEGRVLVRYDADWPHPGTAWTKLYLDAGRTGSAASPNDGSLSLTPGAAGLDASTLLSAPGPKTDLRVPFVVTGVVDDQLRAQGLPPAASTVLYDDLRPEEATGLTYTTPALTRNVEITGPIVLRLWASSNAVAYEWNVRLTDVWPDGRSSWITDGQLRTSLRRVDPALSRYNADGDIIRPWYPFDTHEYTLPGEIVEYIVEITPTSNLFQAGHRLRLDILPVANASLDAPRTGGAGAVVIYRDAEHPSNLLVPLIPSLCDDATPGPEDMAPVSECAASMAEAIG